jgi:Na+/H+ antiporter NhaD/arsenite permease-like protein
MSPDAAIAGLVFLVAYALIATERVDRTLVALLGGLLVVALGILPQDEAFAAIDFNVIFLLAGMMILANSLATTGVFEWLAIRSVRLADGRPYRLLVILVVVTAVLSAFLDNVTTVVLVAPVTLSIAATLGVTPIPFLITQIFASNIGGTATLIGDPPNILIGSAAGLDFTAFLVNLGPVVVVILAAFLVTTRWLFGRGMTVDPARRDAALALDPADAIRDRRLLAIGLLVMGATVVGFLLHSTLHLEAATVALLGATVMLLVGRLDPHAALRDVEWSTLFFFVGLFILVGAVVKVGLVSSVAGGLADALGDNEAAAAIGLLWFSAGASAIVDNIPYTATAIPVVHGLIASGLDTPALWWSLALGACLGGNLTLVGASANIVVANLARRAGHEITFGQFLRYGSIVVAESLVISTAYVWLVYLR